MRPGSRRASAGNAATDGHAIYVNPKFMSKVASAGGEGAVRFVLAHELGHIEGGMVGGPDAELEADQFGARSLAMNGFEEKAIIGVMSHLNPSPTATHPAASSRERKALEVFRKQQVANSISEPMQDNAPKKDFKRMQRLP